MSPALRTTCGVCNGSQTVPCGAYCYGALVSRPAEPVPHTHPCSACRGIGSNPLRSLDDEADERIEALEAENHLLRQALGDGFDHFGMCIRCRADVTEKHTPSCPVLLALGEVKP